MTKADLIEKMAKEAGISKAAAGNAFASFTSNITKALKKKNGKLTLVGLGDSGSVVSQAKRLKQLEQENRL